MSVQQTVSQAFMQRFGEKPSVVVRAPGRVNLIGEHTDYNDGFVLPMAIDRATWIALRSRDDRRIAATSLDFDETREIDMGNLSLDQDRREGWQEYLKGVVWAMQDAGLPLKGWEGTVAGDVPIGAGLSSSAALEMATARALAHVSGLAWDAASMARICQRAENRWVGVNCGIMDQLISAAGVAGAALLIDCRSLETSPAPLPQGTVVVVLDTATRRGLVDSAYNERRAQCEAGAAFFGVKALRDVASAQIAARARELDPTTLRRARHVVTENERTLAAAAAMRDEDARHLGQLMNESHDSLRDDFEVCNDGLNTMVDSARRAPGCYGARMTGAGFGGCAVALVATDKAAAFVAQVTTDYEGVTKLKPNVYVSPATNGAEVVCS
jgi:galactokinase